MGRATAWGLVVGAVVDAWRALPGYVDPAAGGPGVGVYHTTQIGTTGRRDGTYVVVGWTDPDAPGDAGRATQQPWTQGGAPSVRERAETGTVTCLVARSVGDSPLHAAASVVDDVEAILDDLDLPADGPIYYGDLAPLRGWPRVKLPSPEASPSSSIRASRLAGRWMFWSAARTVFSGMSSASAMSASVGCRPPPQSARKQ